MLNSLNKKIQPGILFLVALLTLAFVNISNLPAKNDPKKLAEIYCGSCHVAPDPTDLPGYLWKKTVLPEMGSYYGIKTKGFGLLKKMNLEELEIIRALNIYPDTQLLPDETWKMIQDYYLNNSPDKLEIDKDRKKRNENLKAFKPIDIKLNELPGSLISSLTYDNSKNQLWIGEDRAMAYSWKYNDTVNFTTRTHSVVSDIVAGPDTTYLVEMGSLIPTEVQNGTISIIHRNKKETIIRGLHRPVHALTEDLNADGKIEIVVSNYGDKTGRLSIFKKNNGKFTETIIHRQAGAIKCLAFDMDADGLKDLVAMFAQGDESIYIFYQKEGLKFIKEKILRFNPLFGSNDFELLDYEGDGDMDIVVAQGDNADMTVTPKPYHGIRLFINNDNIFSEKFFYPIYGATKVLTHDFDKDGDIDFIITAFYQAYDIVPSEGLVYLENLDSENFQFQSYSLKYRDPFKSYTLEKGDVDQDGDMDIIVGLFSHTITKAPQHLKELWQMAEYDITILLNKLE